VLEAHYVNDNEEMQKITSIEEVKWNKNEGLIEYIDSDFDDIYLKEVRKLSMSPEAIIQNKNMTIVFSPIHGASGKMVPAALKALAFAYVLVVTQESAPAGNLQPAVSHTLADA